LVFDGGAILLDTFGTVTAAEPENPGILGQDWSDHPCYSMILRAQILGSSESVFSNVVTGEVESICVAVPIIGERDEFLGTLMGLFRLDATTASSFYGVIVKLRIGESGRAYLVDGNGRVIYDTDTERIGDDFSRQLVVEQVLGGQVDAVRTRDADGKNIVASFAPVPGTSWGLVVEESWTRLTSGSRTYQQFLLLLLVLGVAVPILVVAVGVRRITTPITELISAAREVAKGHFGQAITARMGDEVEELANQFNLMSAQLQESYTRLEQRVADRTRELATLNAIATTVSQSLDLNEILDSALALTLQTMEIEAGGIYLLDEKTGLLTIGAHYGFSPEFAAKVERLEVGEGFSGRVVESGEPLVVADISSDSRLTWIAAREEGLHSVAVVPLYSKGKPVGTMFAANRSYREFAEQDIQLLTSIANQIGIAIENARLYRIEQRRAEQFRVITEMGHGITSILNIDELLQEIVRLLKETFGYDLITIGMIEGDELVFRAGTKTHWHEPRFIPPGLKINDQGITAWVATTGEPLLTPDVSQEPRHVFRPEAGETRSELAVPLKTKNGIIGVLNVESDRLNAFDESDVEVLQSLANQAAIAIENARLYEQAQQIAIVEERSRLARELHDSVTQSLYSSTLLAEAGRRLARLGDVERVNEYLARLGEITEQSLKEMRLLVYELRPLALRKEGLVGALNQRLDAVERRAGVEARLVLEGELELPEDVEEALYRIAQEALNNALKHATPTSVTVSVRVEDAHVELEVADDGRGFDPSAVGDEGGMGLVNMQERAEKLGGTLTIVSAAGKGTSVKVRLETVRSPST
jgi:signal transduction histidine kinase/HAMP domain-containing protein